MLKAIEGEVYKVSKSERYGEKVYTITNKEDDQVIEVCDNEIDELIQLLQSAKQIF